MPQFLKENGKFVEMVHNNLREESIQQYKIEERSAISKRIIRVQDRINFLLECMSEDEISSEEKVKRLRKDLFDYTKDKRFTTCKNMGAILRVAFDFVVRNYENVNHYVIH
jgi:DNA-binding protein H-NS